MLIGKSFLKPCNQFIFSDISERRKTLDDSQIIQLYFERSEDAIEKTKIKYGNFCFRIADNILKSKEDAEECKNDAYLRARSSIPPQKPSVLKSYLGKIVRNLALQRYEYYSAKKEIPNWKTYMK
jgi:RNA polymerase sigma-70 factor (ECF subfamily)